MNETNRHSIELSAHDCLAESIARDQEVFDELSRDKTLPSRCQKLGCSLTAFRVDYEDCRTYETNGSCVIVEGKLTEYGFNSSGQQG